MDHSNMAELDERSDPDAAAHCPRCGAEYRAGFDRCADCGVELVAGPAPIPKPTLSKPVDHPDVVTLCRLSFLDARLLVGALQAAGIRAGSSDYEKPWRYPQWAYESMFDVLVEKDQLDEARRVATEVLKQAGKA
jgi:hypothetical protein